MGINGYVVPSHLPTFLSSALESINQGCARMAGWDPGTLLLLGWTTQTQVLVLRLESSFSALPNVISTGANTSHSYSYALPALKLEGKQKFLHAHNLNIPHRHKPNSNFSLIWEVLLRTRCLVSGFPLNSFFSHHSPGGEDKRVDIWKPMAYQECEVQRIWNLLFADCRLII